jgi:hypothetical protein
MADLQELSERMHAPKEGDIRKSVTHSYPEWV